MREHRRIGEILVDLHVLTPAERDRVLEALGRRIDHQKFGEVARNMGLLTEEHILAALAVQMDLFAGIETMSVPEILGHLLADSTPGK